MTTVKTDGVAHDLMRRERKANENFIERTAVHGTKCKSCGGKIDLSSAWYKAPDHPRTYKFLQRGKLLLFCKEWALR